VARSVCTTFLLRANLFGAAWWRFLKARETTGIASETARCYDKDAV